MITIKTKYHGPTNYRGSRVSAQVTSSLGDKKERLSIAYDQSLDTLSAHMKAAQALAEREGWDGKWVLVGDTESGFLFTPHVRNDVTFTIEPKAEA